MDHLFRLLKYVHLYEDVQISTVWHRSSDCTQHFIAKCLPTLQHILRKDLLNLITKKNFEVDTLGFFAT